MQIQITVDARDPHELVHFWTQALDGLDDETLFPDSALSDAIAFADDLIVDVEKYGRQMVLFPYSRLSWLLSDAYPDERPESY